MKIFRKFSATPSPPEGGETEKINVPTLQDLLERVRDLARSYDDLEHVCRLLDSRCDFLEGDLKKMRGRLTGGLRGSPRSDDQEPVQDNSTPAPRGSPAWFEQEKARLRAQGIRIP